MENTNKYLKRFFEFQCYPDIIDVVKPLNEGAKEITESMAIMKYLKRIVLKNPGKYRILDMCAGNALTSILACFLLPIKEAIAIDIKRPKRDYSKVNKFTYIEKGIHNFEYDDKIGRNDIIISVHPCDLAYDIIDIFRMSSAKAAIVMPCCEGDITLVGHEWLRKKMGNYNTWTYEVVSLLQFCDIPVSVITDPYVKSPKNNIIVAVRK